MAIRVQAIQPKKMRIKEVQKALIDALIEEGQDMKSDYDDTISTWSGDKPTFKPKVSTASGTASVEIEPSGNAKGIQKWHWLDQGTSAHTIRPRRARMLAWRTGFKPKTKPGQIKSGPGRKATGPYITAGIVHHPGTKARNWSRAIVKKGNVRFVKRINNAVQRGSNNLY